MPQTAIDHAHGYVMGHSAAEQARLDRQGAVLRDSTFRFLRDHGVGPGMRVLDVGCGTGDVSLVAAELVGPTGEVIGVDRSAEVLATAWSRVEARGASNVRFVRADIAKLDLAVIGGAPVDAAIGRLILLHAPDPVAVLRGLKPLLVEGGLMAFQDLFLLDPLPALDRPLLRRQMSNMRSALTAAGANCDIGLTLPDLYRRAGLPSHHYRLDGIAIDGPDLPKLIWFSETIRTLLPVMEKIGLTTAAAVDIDTLAIRLAEEAEREGGTIWTVGVGGAAARISHS